jgi:hypothetical protein
MENTSLNTICIVRAGYIGAQIRLHCTINAYATILVYNPSHVNISRTTGWDRCQFGTLWNIESTPNFTAK